MRTITLRRLTPDGFKSFTGRAEVHLPSDAGMVLVTGDNRVEPRLGANGCGKSSLWDALFFCLYGTSVRGDRIGELVPYGAEKVAASCVLDIDGREVEISRSGPPARIYIDGERVEPSDVERLVGLTPDQFRHSVLFGQARPLFIDLPIPERGDLLDEVLGSQLWMRAADVAGKRAGAITKDINAARVEVGRAEGAITALESVDAVRTREDAWEQDRVTRVAQQEQAVGQLTRSLTVLGQPSDEEVAWQSDHNVIVTRDAADIGRLTLELEALRAGTATPEEAAWNQDHESHIESLIAEFERLEVQLSQMQEPSAGDAPDLAALRSAEQGARLAAQHLFGDVKSAQAAIRKIEEDLAFFEKTGICPTCSQSLAGEKVDEHVAGLRAQLGAKERELGLLEADREAAAARAEEAEAILREASEAAAARDREAAVQRAKIDAARRELDGMEAQIERDSRATNPYAAAREERVAAMERDVARRRQQLEALHREANPHTPARRARIEATEREIAAAEALLRRTREEVNPHTATRLRLEAETVRLADVLAQARDREAALSSQLSSLEFWRDSFKRVRLFVISRVLKQLDLETMNAAHTLGLVGWTIRYSTETETRSGTQKLGVQVEVESPTRSGSFTSWSGGEGQRIRLCTALGFGNLIQRWSGVRWRLEILDEPTAWLSESGIEDLLDLLRARADSQDKALYLCDHRGLQHHGFSVVLTVVKDASGSMVQ